MRDVWLVYLALGALLLVAGGALVGGWARGRLGTAAVIVFVAAVALWVADFAAISSGYRGADGVFACGEACTGVHFSTAVGFLAPPLLISAAALGALIALRQRQRGREPE